METFIPVLDSVKALEYIEYSNPKLFSDSFFFFFNPIIIHDASLAKRLLPI